MGKSDKHTNGESYPHWIEKKVFTQLRGGLLADIHTSGVSKL